MSPTHPLDPTSQHPTSQHPTGQHPTGQHPTGQHPTGQHPTGQHPAGQDSMQQAAVGRSAQLHRHLALALEAGPVLVTGEKPALLGHLRHLRHLGRLTPPADPGAERDHVGGDTSWR